MKVLNVYVDVLSLGKSIIITQRLFLKWSYNFTGTLNKFVKEGIVKYRLLWTYLCPLLKSEEWIWCVCNDHSGVTIRESEKVSVTGALDYETWLRAYPKLHAQDYNVWVRKEHQSIWNTLRGLRQPRRLVRIIIG